MTNQALRKTPMNHQNKYNAPSFRKKHSSVHHSHSKINDLAKKHTFIGQCSQQNSDSQSSNLYQQGSSVVQIKKSWDEEENYQLASLFNRMGADWINISSKIHNKSPVETKNQFYSILRRIIDSINLELKEKGRRQILFKSIYARIQRIIQQGEQQSTIKGIIKDKLSQLIIEYLKRKQQFQTNSLSKSIENLQIILANINQHRKNKKLNDKASSLVDSKNENQKIQEGYMSDQSSLSQESRKEETFLICEKNVHNDYYADQENYKSSKPCPKGVIVEQTEQRIKNLLRESGILQMVQYYSSSKDLGVNYQESVASSSQNLHNESYQHFFIDQENYVQDNNCEYFRMSKDSDNL